MASLQSGTYVSRYRVMSSIGAGGMGEVYRAVDPTLERDIALKILPPELVTDEDRVRRFVREAKSASSLSHPGIVHIYEIGESKEPPVHYIAMELVEGMTLSAEIHDERAPLKQLTGWLAQVADALAKAHAAGIVHRDLKPENIMISRDGFAKVLDFGVAKLIERGHSGETETQAPTVVPKRTREGAVIGTVGYMSPEQAMGRDIDHRSDIFSFGCVLYEAATRKRPFEAGSDVDTLHRIIHDDPRPVEEINPDVPVALQKVIRRCLAKEQDRRFHSMKDVALELNDVTEQWDHRGARLRKRTASLPRTIDRHRTVLGVLLPAAVVLAMIAVGLLLYYERQERAARSASEAKPTMRHILANGRASWAGLSADGKLLAYTQQMDDEKWELHLRRLTTDADVILAPRHEKPYKGLVFSRDGDHLYFVHQSAIQRISLPGGLPQKLVSVSDSGPSFSPDESHFAFKRRVPGGVDIMVARADGSEERRLAHHPLPDSWPIEPPAWSSDGKLIASGGNDRVFVFDAAAGSRLPMGEHRFSGIYSVTWKPEGDGLLITGSKTDFSAMPLWQLSYPEAQVHQLTDDLNSFLRFGGTTADGGTIAVTRFSIEQNFWLMPPDGSQPRAVTTGRGTLYELPAAGRNHVFLTGTQSGKSRIWRADRDGGALRALPMDDAYIPAVPDDESFLVYMSRNRLFRAEVDGSAVRPIPCEPVAEDILEVSPDGEWLLYRALNGGSMKKLPLRGGEPVTFSGRYRHGASFSPDGRWIAAIESTGTRDTPEALRIAILPSAGGVASHTWNVPIFSAAGLGWMKDRVVFVRDPSSARNLWSAKIDGSDQQPLTKFSDQIIQGFAVGADGTLFLSRGEQTHDVVLLSNYR